MGGVGAGLLGRERVFGKPVQQVFAKPADHLQLRIMHVRVDEPAGDQRVLVMRRLHAVRQAAAQLRIRAKRRDQASVHHNQRVFVVDQALLDRVLERIAAERDCSAADGLHHAGLASRMARYIRSGAKGVAWQRTPVASRMALPNAAATGL